MTDPNSSPAGQTPPPPQPGYQAAPAAGPLTADQDKQYSFWAHLGGIVGFLPSLIIYLVFKDRSNPANPVQVKHEAKSALNWQITFTIAYIALWVVVNIINGVLWAAGVWALTGIISLLPFLLWVYNVVVSVIAAVRINGGQAGYQYPFSFRFIK